MCISKCGYVVCILMYVCIYTCACYSLCLYLYIIIFSQLFTPIELYVKGDSMLRHSLNSSFISIISRSMVML